MKYFWMVSVVLMLGACKPGDPLPPAGPDQEKVSLLFVMNCLNASRIRTYSSAAGKKKAFASERYNYWVGVKSQLFNNNVDRDAMQQLEQASLDQWVHDENVLNLSQLEKVDKY